MRTRWQRQRAISHARKGSQHLKARLRLNSYGLRPGPRQEQGRLPPYRAGKAVTAIIDAGDFPDLRGNTSKSPEWNASAYHDLAVLLSTLIQEQVLTWDPADISPDEIRIRRPADRAKPEAR